MTPDLSASLGETEVIKGFIKEHDAVKWIAEHSEGWQGK
jgi:hypothetical protein